MKENILLKDDWYLWKMESGLFVPGQVENENEEPYIMERPLSVHEALLQAGVLPESLRLGDCGPHKWVAESDWLYQKVFPGPVEKGSKVTLLFGGIDTVADIYLNGKLLAQSNSVYLPLEVDVTAEIREENLLQVYVYSPYQIIEEKKASMPDDWEGEIAPSKLLRKPGVDFSYYLGARPYLTPIGLFEDVFLVVYDQAWIKDVGFDVRLASHYEWADIRTEVSVSGNTKAGQAEVVLIDPQDCEIGRLNVSLKDTEKPAECVLGEVVNTAIADFHLDNPQLWYPKNYGNQPLYRIRVELLCDGKIVDCLEKRIGLRDIQQIGDMKFKVNGLEVKFWGSNFVQPNNISHHWDPERGLAVLKLADEGSMNSLRVWAEGVNYGHEFYDYCDEHGIMIWQDLHSEFGAWPDNEEYRSLMRLEAETMIRRLRHHACIILWCGNNESYMFGESKYGNNKQRSYAVYFQDFPDILRRIDPRRSYIPSSPCGGRYPNDAMSGDTHGYWGAYYIAGLKYPVFFSENCHTTALPMHSMRAFMTEEEIYPEGYVNQLLYGAYNPFYEQNKGKFGFRYWRNMPMPETWAPYMDEFAQCEMVYLEKFYDASDAESLVYRWSASAADYFKDCVESMRCGYSPEDASCIRRTQGHYSWKLNDAFPMVSFTLIDYFMELTAPYYSLKRAYTPVLAVIEAGDHIWLRGVNDTAHDISAKLLFRSFDRIGNKIVNEMEMPVFLLAGESKVFTNLDHLQFGREEVLFCELRTEDGEVLSRNIQHLDIERNSIFPDAKLTIRQERNEIVITTDQYAHYIELTGDADGDAFGWYFSDNYFHLLPFEEKRIRVNGKHRAGRITAKAHYATTSVSLDYQSL